MIASFQLDTSYSRLASAPQALSYLILFPIPATRNADVPVGTQEAKASFPGTAPALGRRRVRPRARHAEIPPAFGRIFSKSPREARGGALSEA